MSPWDVRGNTNDAIFRRRSMGKHIVVATNPMIRHIIMITEDDVMILSALPTGESADSSLSCRASIPNL